MCKLFTLTLAPRFCWGLGERSVLNGMWGKYDHHRPDTKTHVQSVARCFLQGWKAWKESQTKIWNSIYIPKKDLQRYTILLASTKDVLNVDVWICNFHISFTCNRSSANYNKDFNHLRMWSLPGFIFPPKHEIWANYEPTWSKRWFSSTTFSLLYFMWIEPSSVRGCLPSLDCDNPSNPKWVIISVIPMFSEV